MGKLRPQSTSNLDIIVREYEVDPNYFGYWADNDVLTFLNMLLERERLGSKAFAAIGRAADLETADSILDAELTQASLCVLLRQAIESRGATAVAPREPTTDNILARPSLEQAISFAINNQAKLVEALEEGTLKVVDSDLRSTLAEMLQRHRQQIEQLNLLRSN